MGTRQEQAYCGNCNRTHIKQVEGFAVSGKRPEPEIGKDAELSARTMTPIVKVDVIQTCFLREQVAAPHL